MKCICWNCWITQVSVKLRDFYIITCIFNGNKYFQVKTEKVKCIFDIKKLKLKSNFLNEIWHTWNKGEYHRIFFKIFETDSLGILDIACKYERYISREGQQIIPKKCSAIMLKGLIKTPIFLLQFIFCRWEFSQ